MQCRPTTVVLEDDERKDVDSDRKELDHHEPVPGVDGDGNHEQLSEDEVKGVKVMDELGLKQLQSNQYDHSSCREGGREGGRFRKLGIGLLYGYMWCVELAHLQVS